jgi:hypothetical protein
MTSLENETQLEAGGDVVDVATTSFNLSTNLKIGSLVSNI